MNERKPFGDAIFVSVVATTGLAATTTLVVALIIMSASDALATDVTITRSGDAVVLSWPQSATNDFYLQFTTSLAPPVAWSNIIDPIMNGTEFAASISGTGSSRFYRLQAWETLFNGTSTAAFRGYRQGNFPDSSQWSITANGELMAVSRASPIHLITRSQYGSYELRWEWKTSTAGNSGVKYRANEIYSDVTSAGPEYQLLDDLSYSLAAYQYMGAAYRLFAPTNKMLAPVGQWNKCRLIVQSNHVEHWLNGGKLLDYEINSPAWITALAAAGSLYNVPGFGQGTSPGIGYIVFLSQTSPTWFRDIKIRQLPPQ